MTDVGLSLYFHVESQILSLLSILSVQIEKDQVLVSNVWIRQVSDSSCMQFVLERSFIPVNMDKNRLEF